MSTNISKKKRDDLLDKIKQIRAFIAAAPQDENTGNLLSYLSELEKDVNGKKYGLVFEEHREEIDEVLDTHTPVLTEDADLFIDHGVQMNFLIEGDNLASLQLLEKTHKGKIDLIYIDPPYNTGAYPLVSTSIAAKDVDYDLIVYDTYDYLDKLIGFKLSDIFYAIFYQYYEATSDERALRLAKYFKYGTDKEREIWMLRYGFSFEEIEWVSECVDSIDETEIKFNDKINALDDAQLKSIEQYVHE